MALHITSQAKSSVIRPTSKEQLQSIIEQELKRQGPDADLNHIDTEEISDMSFLFCNPYISVRNIKIDQWNVSNVTNMSCMFAFRTEFNCDLSSWNTSNVKDMSNMFDLCCSLDKLPEWYKGNQLVLPSLIKPTNKTSLFMSIVQSIIGILTWATFIYVWFFL
jgi:surface protein